MPDSECLICSMEGADPASRVFLDELWAAEVAPGYEVPGWFFLRARRHAEKLTGLDDAETATFGRHAHDLVSALEQVTGCTRRLHAVFRRKLPSLPRAHRRARRSGAAGVAREARCCGCWPGAEMRRRRRPWPGTSGSLTRRSSVAVSTPPWMAPAD